MFATPLSSSVSTPSTSNLEEEVEPTPNLQDLVPNLPSELLPVTVSELVELKMSLPFQPIPPEERVVEEVEDSD